MIDLELLDCAGIVGATGLPERLVRRLLSDRRLPIVKVGRRVYVRRAELADWIESNTRRPQ